MATSTGRERLLDTAERLFADRGITGVSLREITEAAGQRNASVVQYHFGSRAGLVAAIVERHMAVVDAERARRLDELAGSSAEPDVHTTMQILVEPLAACLTTESGRCYLRMLQHLVDLPADLGGAPEALADTNPSLRRVAALLAGVTESLPAGLRVERQAQTTSFLLRALADRATALDGPTKAGRRRVSHELFVANLIDVLVAVLLTPPSTTTSALARGGGSRRQR